jgi:peptide methionine sulfoxide reductase msrA/msrB
MQISYKLPTFIELNPKYNKNEIMSITNEDWKANLSSEQYYILREKGTERAFTGALLMNKEKGIYSCAGCGNELFTDEMKFDSHCGWPSFDREIAGGKIKKTIDKSHGMIRTEITCAKCDGHLGHIFDDGPTPTGERYCVNSLSLSFEPLEGANKTEEITLGGGCFWCVEAVYLNLKGVIKVESGYSGGFVKNPAYREVCNGTTGHAEVVKITYNANELSLQKLLEVFFTVHDPTTLNRQGNDIGTQYRSVIYFHQPAQELIARSIIKQLEEQKVFSNPIVTEVKTFDTFYKAEDYHQNYYNQHKSEPYCQLVIEPKLDKFKKVFNN